MNNREHLENRQVELSNLYKEHWEKACQYEGAEITAIAVEFSEGNVDAVICSEILKELLEIKAALKTDLI